MMSNWSLKRRMTVAITLVLIIAFTAIYHATKSAFTLATKERIRDSLQAQLYAMMAVSDDYEGQLTLPELVRNERLDHLNSGSVAYVLDVDGDLIWRSQSSDDYGTLPDSSLVYSIHAFTEAPLDGHSMFWIGEKIIWEHANGVEGEYLFLIGEKQSLLRASVRQYKREVLSWLLVTGAFLIAVSLVILNYILRPLNKAQSQIELVRRGDAQRVEGNFPAELQPLTGSINQLLDSESQQKVRYRDTLGNLAHSLKTPLAIIKSEVQKEITQQDDELLKKQVERIDDIVKYQLNRSVVTAGQAMKRKSEVAPEVSKIVDAMNKVHAEKGLQIDYRVAQDCTFPGEAGDLMELVGNLTDNACKWAKSRVSLDITKDKHNLNILVEDDGPGIPDTKKAIILDRGKRLDQQAEGQGLGLSIVMDIVKIYQGDIQVSDSSLGGSRFSVSIPG